MLSDGLRRHLPLLRLQVSIPLLLRENLAEGLTGAQRQALTAPQFWHAEGQAN
ncbi:hypothetical protein [Franconibacter pulveris]|uniref:hypothetical protein n=1 Tax=Franconibacter pulveris TaxID=435910 RepID=UPI000B1EFE74|nr:hypothetical protein [Franconibacter pulveris]